MWPSKIQTTPLSLRLRWDRWRSGLSEDPRLRDYAILTFAVERRHALHDDAVVVKAEYISTGIEIVATSILEYQRDLLASDPTLVNK